MSGPILEARDLVKSYGDRRVVDNLSLRCERGTVLGLLGPNGAGKTTTLRMLYGFIEPEAGSILYDGRDFRAERMELKRTLGVCTQEDTLDYDFSVEQNLRVYAGYFKPRPADLAGRVEELLREFGLDEYRHASPHALSGGYKRRLLIARSVIHRPNVLFLDEPTTGLDPSARVAVWEVIHGMRSAGMAVILTTHYMDEAERLSDRMVVLERGRAIAEGTPSDILGRLLGEHVLVVPAEEPNRPVIERWARTELAAPASMVLGELRVPLKPAHLSELTERFGASKFTLRPPNLDDLFLALSARPDGSGGGGSGGGRSGGSGSGGNRDEAAA